MLGILIFVTDVSQCLECLGCITLDEKVALEEAGSIITVTAGDPEKEEKLIKKLNGQKCKNHEEEDYFCCGHPSESDQKPKYGNSNPANFIELQLMSCSSDANDQS